MTSTGKQVKFFQDGGLKPCPLCQGTAVQHQHMLRVVCVDCGASTRDYTGTKGRFQLEHDAARWAWNRGDVLREVHGK